MKKFLLLLCLTAVTVMSQAAFVKNMPVKRLQPNGDTLNCYVTGDEYYHRMHDALGYTIVLNEQTGYYVYGVMQNGELVASNYVAGTVNPATLGISPNLAISRRAWSIKQKAWDIPERYKIEEPKTSGRNHGTINNLVIFVRFSDESEITTPMSSIEAMCNDSSANSISMYQYFKEASYNKLHIVSHYAPTPNGNAHRSYQDSHPRSYYEPYSATNTNGYATDSARTAREFTLFENAVNYINANYPVNRNINLDYNNDGLVDNVIFIVKGTYTGWSGLLWPHKWSLYDRTVRINGKRVYTFNLQLEGSGDHYFSSSVFCHETFHTLGAPDLYRYYVGTDISSVGPWDLMCNNSTPPQHMGIWMKYRYGNWIDSIPEITAPGTYTLHSVADQANVNNAYCIRSSDPNQWYIFEYRDNREHFETTLPGTGLLIYRIDTRYSGNANYDGTSAFDEVYIYRPGGNNSDTTTAANGTLSQAYFSAPEGRTTFSYNTNPRSWLNPNTLDSAIRIYNISTPGDTICFTYGDGRGCSNASELEVVSTNNNSANLTWYGRSTGYRVSYRPIGSATWSTYYSTRPSCTITGLTANTQYEWKVRSVCGGGDSSNFSVLDTFKTLYCATPTPDTIGSIDTTLVYFPTNSQWNYVHTQQIVLASEMGGARQLSAIRFHFDGSAAMRRSNCVIYVGHTTRSQFSGRQDAVACSTLTKVYEGDMVYYPGWNNFRFDQTFDYNGTDNLIIAIDDNNGVYYSEYRFSCSNTTGYRSLCVYSDDENPDPNRVGSHNGHQYVARYRSVMQLVGCDIDTAYTLTVNSADATMGTVSGGGSYHPGDTAILTANALSGYHFSHWQDDDTINPRSVVVWDNATYTAYFENDPSSDYTLHALSNDTTWGTVSGSGIYTVGDTAILTATPATGFHFVNWSTGDTSNPLTLILQNMPAGNDTTITGYFAPDTNTTFTITALSADITMGTVSGGDSNYHYGDTVILTATATTGNHFVRWNDGITTNPRTIIVLGDATYTATFASDNTTYTVDVISDNPAQGTVNGGGSGYHYGDTVTISATPAANYHFVRWSDYDTNNPRTIVVIDNVSLTAFFAIDQHHLAATSANTGMGTVNGSGDYNHGDTATITATAATGYHFVSWNDSVTTNPRQVIVTCDTSFTANFAIDAPNTFNINVYSADLTQGTVTGSGTYRLDDTITISANALNGYAFDHWNDYNTDNPRTIVVTANASYTAYFTSNQAPVYNIVVLSNNSNWGSVSGSGTYSEGTSATISATAYAGYHFVRWTDGNTDNPRTFTVLASGTYTAQFAANQTYALINVQSADSTIGTVTGGGTYLDGSSITLTARPIAHYHFTRWVSQSLPGGSSTTNPLSVTVNGDATYTAHFAADHYTVNVSTNNPAYGTATGGGDYLFGTVATLRATPVNEHYHFVSWQDGNTDNPRTVRVSSDTSFTAQFEPYQHTIILRTAAMPGYHYDADMCSTYGEGVYDYGTELTLTAVGTNGNMFMQWSDGIHANPRTITVTKDSVFTAQFRNQVGIDDAESSHAIILTAKGSIKIVGAEGESIQIIDMMGRCIASQAKATNPCVFHTSHTGIYFVKIGDAHAEKVYVM
jgi:M6 family metalloprotease-like protein